MFCSVFWMQKLRGSGWRPVVQGSLCFQPLNMQCDRQPMHSAWSRRISRAFSGVTKIRVQSGVRMGWVKPSARQRSTRRRSSGFSHTPRPGRPIPRNSVKPSSGSASSRKGTWRSERS
ncbi:hypothetical protein HRbin39_00489 [bacterium HR39]|nr:hypothetical protein HRbin39_00489 [bacterium HR39]